jgi:hypothetical protein
LGIVVAQEVTKGHHFTVQHLFLHDDSFMGIGTC